MVDRGRLYYDSDGKLRQVDPSASISGEPDEADLEPVEFVKVTTDQGVITGSDLEDALSKASAGDTIVLSKTTQVTPSGKITISNDDTTILGGNLKTPDSLDDFLIDVTGDGVIISGLKVEGNKANNTDEATNSIIHVTGSDFTAMGLDLNNSPQHGLHIDGASTTISNVSIRDIVGDANERDLVSLEGPNLSDVDVTEVRGTNSVDRGTVEIVDGCTDVIVRNVYGEGQLYTVDIQDHNNSGEDHHDIVIDGVRAETVTHAVRADMNDLGHADIRIENVRGSNWQGASFDEVPVYINQNITGLVLRDVVIDGFNGHWSIRVIGCDDVEAIGCGGGNDTSTNGVITYLDCNDVRSIGGRVENTDGHGVKFNEVGGTHSGFSVTGLSADGMTKEDLEFQNDLTEIAVGPVEAAVTNSTDSETVKRSPAPDMASLTAADGSTVDATYGAEERDVIQNLVTRQAEIVDRLGL